MLEEDDIADLDDVNEWLQDDEDEFDRFESEDEDFFRSLSDL